jgi:hypothetical protein
MLDKDFWLDHADSFQIFTLKRKFDDTLISSEMVTIKKCPQKDGSIKFGVFLGNGGMMGSSVLSKHCIQDYLEGNREEAYFFIIQSMPSNRTQEELDDTRFDTIEEAYKAFQKIKEPFYNNYLIAAYRDTNKYEVIE